MHSIEESTREFYEWESRGRGWWVWDVPVELEPPFTPFRFHGQALPPSTVDDGRRPGLIGSFANRLLNPFRRRPEAFVDESMLPPEAIPSEKVTPVVELQLIAPPDFKVAKEAMEQLLVGIAHLERPIAFEIIGDSTEIVVQFAVREEDASQLAHHFAAYAPGLTVAAAKRSFADRWQSLDGETLLVDFGLSREFMLPLRTMRTLDIEPLSGVFGALAGLADGEIAAFQVLFQGARNSWGASVARAVTDGMGSAFFADAPDLVAQAEKKVSRPLFAACIRAGVRAASQERALTIARALGGALQTLADPAGNELLALTNDDYGTAEHEADLLARTTHRSGMLLNSDELVALVHPPSDSVQLPRLKRVTRVTKAAPSAVLDNDIVLGVNDHAGAVRTVTLTTEHRVRHTYVIGASGTGKSTLLLNLITQDLEAGNGFGLLDPHGDLVDAVLERIPEHRLDDVIIFDPADVEYPVGFNILGARTELEKVLLASDLIAVFRRLSESWGDQMDAVFANAIVAYLESDRGGTLADLRRFLVDKAYRAEFLTTVTDDAVVHFWEHEFPLLTGRPQASILTRLDAFLRPKPIRSVLGQREAKLDLGAVMNDGKIFLAKLAQGAIGEKNAYLLGTLLVAKFQQLALSRQEIAESKRRPFYLYIDEFHNFVTPTMADILSGARKYRLGLVLAHQDLEQLASRDRNVLSAVLANPSVRVCFRVGESDAKTLEKGFTSFDRGDLQRLGTGQAIVRVGRADHDFNIDVQQPERVNRDVATHRRTEAVTRSRVHYARPRAEVEAMLAESAVRTARAAPPAAMPAPSVTKQPAAPPAPQKHAASPPPPSAPPEVSAPKPSGRGGAQHRYVQGLIAKWATTNGWRASVEERVLDGLGVVDVALRKGDRSVACEITVTTTPEHEVGNVQKCLAAGFERVLVIAVEAKTLKAVRRLVEQTLSPTELPQVSFLTVEDAFAFLDGVEESTLETEGTVHGYTVKVRRKPAADGDAQGRRTARVVAMALKRLDSGTRS